MAYSRFFLLLAAFLVVSPRLRRSVGPSGWFLRLIFPIALPRKFVVLSPGFLSIITSPRFCISGFRYHASPPQCCPAAPPWMRCPAAQFPQQIPGYFRLVTSLLSLLLPVFTVFVASFPVFSAILRRCDFPVISPSLCFSRVFRFCCPVPFSRLRRPVASVRSLLRFRIWHSARSPRT